MKKNVYFIIRLLVDYVKTSPSLLFEMRVSWCCPITNITTTRWCQTSSKKRKTINSHKELDLINFSFLSLFVVVVDTKIGRPYHVSNWIAYIWKKSSRVLIQCCCCCCWMWAHSRRGHIITSWKSQRRQMVFNEVLMMRSFVVRNPHMTLAPLAFYARVTCCRTSHHTHPHAHNVLIRKGATAALRHHSITKAHTIGPIMLLRRQTALFYFNSFLVFFTPTPAVGRSVDKLQPGNEWIRRKVNQVMTTSSSSQLERPFNTKSPPNLLCPTITTSGEEIKNCYVTHKVKAAGCDDCK